MDTERRIKKVARYHFVLFILPVFSLLFYGWLRAPELNERPDNPQRLAAPHMRGEILDRTGRPLANTKDGIRQYPQKEAAGSLVGYQLRGRNHTGLESSLQIELSPPLPPATLTAAIQADRSLKSGEREKLRGPNIALSLDLELQKELYRTLFPKAGALVVADREGVILAAVSSPSFDPNTVGEKWQELRNHPQSPFIERVGGGLYPVTLKDGKSILKSVSDSHPWFNKEAFPNYPGASNAHSVEGRLLITPLMLLQYAYSLAHLDPVPIPTIFSEKVSRLDLPLKLNLDTTHRARGQFRVFHLEGPVFKKSPQFLAQVGHRNEELFYVLVVEDTEESSQTALETRLWAILEAYSPPQEISRPKGVGKLEL